MPTRVIHFGFSNDHYSTSDFCSLRPRCYRIRRLASALRDFEEMWAAWDFITQKMIPDSMMFEKPIDLRHICLFYTGHIPAFLDIHLSRLLDEPYTEPEYFKVRPILT